MRMELAIVSLPWDEVASILAEAAATNTLHADVPHQACRTLGLMIRSYGWIGRPDSKEMIRLEEQLTTSHDERLRRIALVALVAQVEEARGRKAEHRARLETYRADPSILVAAAAQCTRLPDAEA
jgi:hypothetical protein